MIMREMTKEEARRILAPVPYDKRLTAGRMFMPSGIHREMLGSVEEVYSFLSPCSRNLPAIDFGRLADWIETALQNAQAAELVRQVSVKSGSYVETCKAIYKLLGEIIEEAEQAINKAV